jgi:hypothetical protein
MKQLLDDDKFTGIKTYHIEDGTKTHIQRVQDVEPILNANKELKKDDSHWQRGVKNNLVKVASIPNTIIEQWLKLGVNIFRKEDEAKVKKLLNSPEWSYLRCVNKKI